MNTDFLVLGGGVMGLCIARELAAFGSVSLLENTGRRPASWAAAGILPPGAPAGHDGYQKLAAFSARLHKQLAATLKSKTGIDVEYQRSGGLHLANSAGEAAALAGTVGQWRSDGIHVEAVTNERLQQLEPALATEGAKYQAVFLVPEESQVRPPRFLRALREACQTDGVHVHNLGAEPPEVLVRSGTVVGLSCAEDVYHAENYVFAAGAWTGELLRDLRAGVELEPIRGQMMLFCDSPVRLHHIINHGPNYVVPRKDGRILVGSTVEEAGFDDSTTERGISELFEFVCQHLPSLSQQSVERTWAGLRPRTGDGFPYVGSVPGTSNAYVATGHYRAGIQLAPGTARVLTELILGRPPSVSLESFRMDRE